MIPSSVVPEIVAVREADFQFAVTQGLNRARRNVGERILAFAMDLTSKGLRNVFGGSMPSAKRMWDVLSVSPCALDDVAALYGRKLVPADEAELDRGTVTIAALLAKVAEAESPDSPGGVAMTHEELLAMEHDIRAVHRLTGGWIEQVAAARAPRRVPMI